MKVRMIYDHRELYARQEYDLPPVRALALIERNIAESLEKEKVERAVIEQPSTATKAPQRGRRKSREKTADTEDD